MITKGLRKKRKNKIKELDNFKPKLFNVSLEYIKDRIIYGK